MNLLENLNENQKKAVLHTEGPLLILAGAGSGKTRVITHRIAHLIKEKNVKPWKIFAVTFTNKAAEEMRNRISSLIGPPGSDVFIKTFHSASVNILRRYGKKISVPSNFTIYDQSDQQKLVKDILVSMRLDPKKIKPATVVSKISEIKDKRDVIEGADISAFIPDYFAFDFIDVYNKYHEKLLESNALDFNDLLIKTVDLIRTVPDVLKEMQDRWTYFMVDEYQDTNYSQYLIAKNLSAASRNICVVGDDDQSIYSWRGADIKNILDFEKDYIDATVITLGENYRSSQQILDAASNVITNNINRKEKNLQSFKGEGEIPVWCQTNNEYGEAEYVVNSILTCKYRNNYRNSDFAIFYRTNAQSRLFEEHLRRENVPYKVIGGLKFYDRKEIKDIVAYLKFIVNSRDSVSLARIINTPARGIGAATIRKIEETAASQQCTMWEIISNDRLTGKIPKGIGEFKNIILSSKSSLMDTPSRIKLSKLVSQIIDLSGYKKNLEEEDSRENQTRVENIEELINSVFDYELSFPEASLDQFLQDVSLQTSEENPEENPDDRDNYITLMTVHNAKGLEFPVVFLTGMEENIFPHKFSIDTDEGIEEERRLCYVGITRAMDQLFITNAELRRTYGGVEFKQPSRFIDEIPPHLISVKSYYSQDSGSSSSRRNASSSAQRREIPGNSFSSSIQSKNIPETVSHEKNSTPHDPSAFSVREKVRHPKYGTGQIIKIEGAGDNRKLTITFGKIQKTFLEKYTPLDKLN